MAAFPGYRLFLIRLRLFSLIVILLVATVGLIFSGSATSRQAVVVGESGLVQPGISGRVARVLVRLGDEVAAGDVVVELDSNRIWLDLEALQTRRDGAEARWKAVAEPWEAAVAAAKAPGNSKKKRSRKKALVRPAGLDALQEEFSLLETQVAMLEEDIEQYRLRAPVAGEVQFVLDGLLGRWVNPGEPLVAVMGGPARVRAWFAPADVLGWLVAGESGKFRRADTGKVVPVAVAGVGQLDAEGVLVEFTAADERSLGFLGVPGTVVVFPGIDRALYRSVAWITSWFQGF